MAEFAYGRIAVFYSVRSLYQQILYSKYKLLLLTKRVFSEVWMRYKDEIQPEEEN